jgi:8-oxo-dGTP pyrophosphatase MutT (NUDIX family)
MQEYVAGFMFCRHDLVPLVLKLKPMFLAGLFNGIGGKIEPGEETPLFAMRREWREETGNDHREWIHVVSTQGEDGEGWRTHFFMARVDELPVFPNRNDAGESICILDARNIGRRSDIVPDLRWIIPLALDGTRIVMPNSTELYGAIPDTFKVRP